MVVLLYKISLHGLWHSNCDVCTWVSRNMMVNLNVEQKCLEEQRDSGWWCNWWVEGDYVKLMNPRGLNLPSGQNTASCRGDFNKTLEPKLVLMCVFVVLGFENDNRKAFFPTYNFVFCLSDQLINYKYL